LQIIFLGAHYSATNAHVVGRDFIMTSFAPILNGLGLKCQFVEDQEATERLKSRVPPRKSSFVRGAPSIVLTVRYSNGLGAKALRRALTIRLKSSARNGHAKRQSPAGGDHDRAI
jgi:hypothetical protein